MQIIILGSGTSIPHPERASPGLVVRLERTTILIDPSSGSLHRAARLGVGLAEIDQVFFTHFHLDHTGELGPLLFALQNPRYFSSKRLILAGPPGLAELHRGLVGLFGSWVDVPSERLRVREIDGGTLSGSSWSVRWVPVEHTRNSHGLRFTDSRGRVFSYTGDSDLCPGLKGLLEAADVALVEAAYPSAMKVPGHLTPELAGRLAAEAGVKRLILTHLYPPCDGLDLISEVRSGGYEGEAEIARDGMTVRI